MKKTIKNPESGIDEQPGQPGQSVVPEQPVQPGKPKANLPIESNQNLTSVLISIQNELKVPKSQFNEFAKYKFRSAEDILENLKPVLRKYNSTILLSDKVHEIGGFIYIEATATLITPTGSFQCQASAGIDAGRKGMDLSQCFGTASSYARKFCLQGLFLLDDGKDADSLNKHDQNETRVPFMTDVQFESIVKRYHSGETDIFEKAKKHFQFTPKQTNQISSFKK